MLEYKLGYFATSLCGHDKGRIYMIVKQEGEMIGLSDGVRRTIDNRRSFSIPDFFGGCQSEDL